MYEQLRSAHHVRDVALQVVTSAQVRMARAAFKLDVRDLAGATRLHRNTITNIETGRCAGDVEMLTVIASVLKRAGMEFIEENGGGLGVRLRKGHQVKPDK